MYFAFNSAQIDPASDRSLAALARMLAEHRDWVMTVEGHTDSIGTAAANQKLSQRRAEAVRGRLADRHAHTAGDSKGAAVAATAPVQTADRPADAFFGGGVIAPRTDPARALRHERSRLPCC